LRLGSPSLTTRGFDADAMRTVGELIDKVLSSRGDEKVASEVSEQVRELCARFPMPH
jgi:glycine hydroxymethyltransferase